MVDSKGTLTNPFPGLALTEFPDLPPGDVLITGATGFLGGRFVRALLASGVPPARLRCLVRDPERGAGAGLPAAMLRRGDLARGDAATLRAAADGVGAVVHFAGAVKGLCVADFDAVNVDGTAHLCAAVLAVAPAAHLLCISSLAAAGPSVDGATSTLPAERGQPVSWYGDSKRRGELVVVRSGLAHTILRPPVVYGPGDSATRLLFRQATALLVAVPKAARPLSIVHADDVVVAVRRALATGATGAVLPLDGPQRTDTHALMRAIALACGRRARLLPVPMFLAGAAAAVCDLAARLRGRPGFFSRDKMREVAAPGWVADPAPALRILGFRAAIGLTEGLAAVARAEGHGREPKAGG